MNEEFIERLNEIDDLIVECSNNAINSIWQSDKDYTSCSVEVIHEYASCLGKISGLITAMKIEAKRGFLND